MDRVCWHCCIGVLAMAGALLAGCDNASPRRSADHAVAKPPELLRRLPPPEQIVKSTPADLTKIGPDASSLPWDAPAGDVRLAVETTESREPADADSTLHIRSPEAPPAQATLADPQRGLSSHQENDEPRYAEHWIELPWAQQRPRSAEMSGMIARAAQCNRAGFELGGRGRSTRHGPSFCGRWN